MTISLSTLVFFLLLVEFNFYHSFISGPVDELVSAEFDEKNLR